MNAFLSAIIPAKKIAVEFLSNEWRKWRHQLADCQQTLVKSLESGQLIFACLRFPKTPA